jgi:hypothetical protein
MQETNGIRSIRPAEAVDARTAAIERVVRSSTEDAWRRPPAPRTQPRPYRPSWIRARWAMALVGLTVGLVAVGTLIEASAFEFIGTDASPARLDAWASAYDLSWSLSSLMLIVSGIAFLAWQSRVVENVPALGAGQPMASPRWSIAWWFIPIANVWMPYRVVADLWHRLGTTRAGRRSTLVLVWWVLWLAGDLVWAVAGRFSPTSVDEWRLYFAVSIAGDLAMLGAGVALLLVIWEIERRVTDREARRAAWRGSELAAVA